MRPYPPEVREEARRLREEGLGYKTIGRKLGVSNNTVKTWLDEEHRLRMNEINKARKARYRGTCIDCGGPCAWGGGKARGKTSHRCLGCHRLYLTENYAWTQEKVVVAIQRWAREHDGRPPTATEWIRKGEYWPSATAIYGCDKASPFTSWNQAIEAAGFTPRPSSPGPGRRTWSKEEAIRLRELGLTDTEIAARFGVSPSAIFQALGRRPPRPLGLAPVLRKRSREQRIADLKKALAREDSLR